MKRTELDKLVAPHKAEIEVICERIGAPLRKIVCDGSLNTSQRKAGLVGRVYLLLADDEPGWRQKDNPAGRKMLKTLVRSHLMNNGVMLAVMIQARYSALAEVDGMIHRRDDTGRTIAVYEA